MQQNIDQVETKWLQSSSKPDVPSESYHSERAVRFMALFATQLSTPKVIIKNISERSF